MVDPDPDTECGDPYSGIGCPIPGCLHQPPWRLAPVRVSALESTPVVIHVTRLGATPSSEVTIGPFDTPDEATRWLKRQWDSGRWSHEEWQTPRVAPLASPDAPAE